ncbi:MAG: PDZ domain-containing protein [Verrucomicrobiales bacterium]|nr:PDZ domain-containing protein [Verrucomicrobiales bacterium]
MNQQLPIWIGILCLGLGAADPVLSQSAATERGFQLRSVAWPGLGKTTAVCVEKDGLYVCVLPEGRDSADGDPRIFNEAGDEMAAKVLHCDSHNGICLLETSQSKTSEIHLPLSTRPSLEPGVALTSLLPEASFQTRVAGTDREYLGKELPSPMLRVRVQADMKCDPGTPLLNEAGELEGLISNRKPPAPNEAHAIPADVIRKVIIDVENHRKSAPVWVGMIFRSKCSTPQVVEVKDDSPASDAGFQANDIVLEVNDRKIGDLGDLVEALKLLPGEKAATFKVLRELDEKELKVVPKFVE